MTRFLRDPLACASPGNRVLGDLVYGWGNAAWSANDDYLAACIHAASQADGPVLECGSGLTTLLVGAMAARQGRPYWALEHTPQWADRVRSELGKWGVEKVNLCIHPLKDYGEFSWYDPPWAEMPEKFALIICDGPPSETKGGRYGLMPVLGDRIGPGTTILLDDVVRPEEREIAARWKAEYGAVPTVDRPELCYWKLHIPAAASQE